MTTLTKEQLAELITTNAISSSNHMQRIWRLETIANNARNSQEYDSLICTLLGLNKSKEAIIIALKDADCGPKTREKLLNKYTNAFA